MTWSSSKPGVIRTSPADRWAPEDFAERIVPEPIDVPAADEPPPEIAAAAAAAAAHEAALQDAYAQGYEDGRLEGERGEQARLRSAVQAAQEALDAIRDGEERWTGTIEENVCALATAIARQLIGREVAADRKAVAALVRRALDEFPVERQLRIRVHPQDLALLQSSGADEDTADRLAAGREVRWVGDVGIGRAGCIVEGRERIIDGRVDAALERVYRRLTYTDV
ncbi:MAG: FliH/SctL family protein [Gemmatimonadaceae bacterium]|nr:FliH/SctL family protein [Gemmatimonadaceae bacterium]